MNFQSLVGDTISFCKLHKICYRRVNNYSFSWNGLVKIFRLNEKTMTFRI